jgi:hydrogenase expression/formation protein HypE
LRGDIRSDAASVLPLTRAAVRYQGLRFMRDPTRGGLATVCTEMHRATGMGVRLMQTAIPVRDAVQSVCEMLGYDPMYLACEGRVVAVIDPAEANGLLRDWRALEQGSEAAVIGAIDARAARVLVSTEIGGERMLEELEDDPLPRIC